MKYRPSNQETVDFRDRSKDTFDLIPPRQILTRPSRQLAFTPSSTYTQGSIWLLCETQQAFKQVTAD